MSLGKPYSARRPGGPVELGASVPGAALQMVGEQASGQAGEGRYCGAAWAPEPRPATRSRQATGSGQPGSRRAVVKAEGAAACPGQLREAQWHRPAPPVGHHKKLLLFGEEAESLFLFFLAKAGVRAGDGGQGQALGLGADTLGLVDGGAHTLQPGQHLLLQGGRVRASHFSGEASGEGGPRTTRSEGALRSSGSSLFHLPLC